MPICLAIIAGASEFPSHPSFETIPSFSNSAEFFREYLTSPDGLALSTENVLWLFDNGSQPGAIIESMIAFLKENADNNVTDIFFYYVGHGTYVENRYCLALRCTNSETVQLTCLPVQAVAKVLFELTPNLRHIVIIDACYASGALADFAYMDDGMSALVEVKDQVRELLPETDISRGTALFCAAGPKIKAKAPWESKFTMFSGALREALTKGDPSYPDYLSLDEVSRLVEREITSSFRGEAVRPHLHTPRAEVGDIRTVQLFPNPARRPRWRALETAVQELREQSTAQSLALNGIRTTLEKLLISNDQQSELDKPTPDLRGRVKYLIRNPNVPDAAITHLIDVVLRTSVYVEQALWNIDIEDYKQEHKAYRVKASTEYHYVNMFSDQQVTFDVLYGVRPDDIYGLDSNAEVGRYIRIAIGEQDRLKGRGPIIFKKEGVSQTVQVTLNPLEKLVFKTEYSILMATDMAQGIRPSRFVKVLNATIRNNCASVVKIRVDKRGPGAPDTLNPTEDLVVLFGQKYVAASVQGISPGERAFCFTLPSDN